MRQTGLLKVSRNFFMKSNVSLFLALSFGDSSLRICLQNDVSFGEASGGVHTNQRKFSMLKR